MRPGDDDPFTLEIVAGSLQAVADEMFAVLRRTAMSAIIYEVLDAGTAVTDAEGGLASSGAGIPSFVGVLDKAVRRVLELHLEPRPGDVFATNDPFYGGVTHLNDVVLAMPVFVEERLVAWAATIAHWNDVGGMAPGSISTKATDLFQEGLRLPAVKVVDGGEEIVSVTRILSANSRLPDFLVGDLWAGIAAVRLGARRIGDLAARYGVAAFLTALERLLDHGEAVARHALASLPHGTFSLSEAQDSGAVYTVTVELSAEEMLVDLRDNPDQDHGPANVSRDGATIAAQMALMNLLDAGAAANAGHFRPLTVLTRRGSVFDPCEPAAMGVYYEVRIRLYDLILRCLAPHLGGRVPSGGFSSICGTFIGGRHPDTGRHFTIVEPEVGGWGATPGRDGLNAQFSILHGDTYTCPAEVAEARYGLHVERTELNGEPGGEGRTRGGKGILLEYRVRADDCFLTCAYTRSLHPPWAQAGGLEGSPNFVEVVRRDGAVERFAVATTLRVDEGDLIRIRTGNGGGYGPPAERSLDLLLDDLRNGYVTGEIASGVYGLAVD